MIIRHLGQKPNPPARSSTQSWNAREHLKSQVEEKFPMTGRIWSGGRVGAETIESADNFAGRAPCAVVRPSQFMFLVI
jgi:hypothetical protein